MYRQILQDRERAVASPEVAALFYSTTFFCNFPLSLFFDEIDVLCAFAFWRVRFFVMKTFPQKGATIRPVQGQAVYTIGNMDSGGARQGIRLPTQRFQTF